MHYGNDSWIGVLIFGGLFAMRMFSSQRRRRGYGRAPFSSRSSFTAPGFQGSATESATPSPDTRGETFTGIAPGWLPDPFAKHNRRYWSGTEWTEHVTDDGVPGTDPPPRSG